MAAVRSGQRVFVHGGAAVPRALLAALVARGRAGELRDVELVHLHTLGPAPYAAPELAGAFRHRALFVGANVRAAVQAGRADFVPVFLSDIPGLFRSGRLPLDVALLNVSPPDAHGFCSLGTSVDVAKAAAESAKTVVAQLNPAVPRSLGDAFVHVGRFARHAARGRGAGGGGPGGAHRGRARPSGPTWPGWWRTGRRCSWASGPSPTPCSPPCAATATWGCTRRCSATAWSTSSRRGSSPGPGSRSTPGKVVASFVVGTRRTYAFVARQPGGGAAPLRLHQRHRRDPAPSGDDGDQLRPPDRPHRPGLRRLAGRRASTAASAGRWTSCAGPPWPRGASPSSPCPATARGGTLSRIVPALTDGAGVTTTRAHVHYVATEYGVADLHGKSLRERARALIALAAPAFREDLERAARDLSLA